MLLSILGGGSGVVNSLFTVAPIVCEGSVFGPCFVIHYYVFFKYCNRIDEEEGAGSFTLIVFRMSCDS